MEIRVEFLGKITTLVPRKKYLVYPNANPAPICSSRNFPQDPRNCFFITKDVNKHFPLCSCSQTVFFFLLPTFLPSARAPKSISASSLITSVSSAEKDHSKIFFLKNGHNHSFRSFKISKFSEFFSVPKLSKPFSKLWSKIKMSHRAAQYYTWQRFYHRGAVA